MVKKTFKEKINNMTPNQLNKFRIKTEKEIDKEQKKKPFDRNYERLISLRAEREDIIMQQVKVKNDLYLENRDKKQVKQLR